MSHRITVAEVGQLVAKHIDRSWPIDKNSVYQYLDLIQERIWASGLFSGSTKWAYASVMKDNTIITPHGYSVLLGAKIGCEPAVIKDKFWTIHKNGPAKEPNDPTHFSNIIQHLGDYPTLIEHSREAFFKCDKPVYNIGVVADGAPSYMDPPVTVISGHAANGKPIYTYGKEQDFKIASEQEIIDRETLKLAGDDMYLQSDVLEGLQIPVTNKFITHTGVDFTEIYNIAKDPTPTRVDYYAVPKDNSCEAILIASLEPFQTYSSYSVYKIKQECVNQGCCYALFKRSRPDKIVSDNQFFLITNLLAILDFAKYVHHTYYKDNIAVGSNFLNSALQNLAIDVENENPTKESTFQVDNPQRNALKKRRFR